jgi:hypothetical protein
MSDPEHPEPKDDASAAGGGERDAEQDAMRALLKRSSPAPHTPPDLLPGVQRRIRRRSRGKFFSDAWSTGTDSRTTWTMIALVTLLLVALAYYALGPMALR